MYLGTEENVVLPDKEQKIIPKMNTKSEEKKSTTPDTNFFVSRLLLMIYPSFLNYITTHSDCNQLQCHFYLTQF